MLLAIESSCDESAAALFDVESYLKDGKSLSESLVSHGISSQIDLHKTYGGVVPELAAREHLKNLPVIVEEVLSLASEKRGQKISMDELSAIAVTQGPGLKGCLLVGVSYAKGLSMQLGLPLIPVNHLEGHVLSALLCETLQSEESVFPALCLLVSGGHTQLLYCKAPGSYECLASTMDDAAGEAFDKVGTLLGLSYPAGAAVSALARKAESKDLVLPIGVPGDDSHFSFSGLKTAAVRMIQAEQPNIEKDPSRVSDIAYALEVAIVEALSRKLERVLKGELYSGAEKPKSLFLSGGVAANERLRNSLAEIANRYDLQFLVPRMEFCTDNAAMIGVGACVRLKREPELLESENIGSYDFPVLPRFPLSLVSSLGVV